MINVLATTTSCGTEEVESDHRREAELTNAFLDQSYSQTISRGTLRGASSTRTLLNLRLPILSSLIPPLSTAPTRFSSVSCTGGKQFTPFTPFKRISQSLKLDVPKLLPSSHRCCRLTVGTGPSSITTSTGFPMVVRQTPTRGSPI